VWSFPEPGELGFGRSDLIERYTGQFFILDGYYEDNQNVFDGWPDSPEFSHHRDEHLCHLPAKPKQPMPEWSDCITGAGFDFANWSRLCFARNPCAEITLGGHAMSLGAGFTTRSWSNTWGGETNQQFTNQAMSTFKTAQPFTFDELELNTANLPDIRQALVGGVLAGMSTRVLENVDQGIFRRLEVFQQPAEKLTSVSDIWKYAYSLDEPGISSFDPSTSRA
jgi:hypothetical protein